MEKITPKAPNMSEPKYNLPVAGPIIAFGEGVSIATFCSLLYPIQLVPVGLAYFSEAEIVEIDYAFCAISYLNLAYEKGGWGVINQAGHAYNYFINSDGEL
jgi:hypothetical protein